ncbi:CysB family HTH-type transcriptional regulator [Amphibiibacter pelophylacis]|uniref:CysB family HTH-type transcriptional regulator n=1 Tax=Amphibiibacter pelophylacis TaxID=1799477 RepID=A0ACC6P4E9_9BURK
MNLHQFRFVQEAVRRNLNLTETARVLHTSQPGISKAILELEEELGIDIFVRHGKRLRRVSEPGQKVLESVEIILREVANLRRIGQEFSRQDVGRLSIATTHTQARYMLPEPLARLRQIYPKVQVSLHQGTPDQVTAMLLDEVADVGLATESVAESDALITFACHEWQHAMVVPQHHELAQLPESAVITLEQLQRWPLITYQPSFAGRKRIDAAFEQRQLTPQIALEAIDSDIIKTYVRLGMGVGIIAEMALQPPGQTGEARPDKDLVWRPLGHLFGSNTSRLAFKRGVYARDYVLTFAELFSPRLTRELLLRTLQGPGKDHYEL